MSAEQDILEANWIGESFGDEAGTFKYIHTERLDWFNSSRCKSCSMVFEDPGELE
jgi:hypothetical protein